MHSNVTSSFSHSVPSFAFIAQTRYSHNVVTVPGDTLSAFKLIDWSQPYPPKEDLKELSRTAESQNLMKMAEIRSFGVLDSDSVDDRSISSAKLLFPNAKLLAPTQDVIRFLIVAFNTYHSDTSVILSLF